LIYYMHTAQESRRRYVCYSFFRSDPVQGSSFDQITGYSDLFIY
jgi:hypothetical protein